MAAVLTGILMLAGCTEEKKIRDLDAVVLSEEVLPKELKEIIDQKKLQPFQLTYSDQKNLYICIGYGRQETGGYSIAMDELYLTDAAVHIKTTLIGPDTARQAKKTATCPYIVIKTEMAEQPVIFD